MLGEHGDSSVYPWSLNNIKVDDESKKEIEEFVKKSGSKIISGKGATFYAIASAVCKLVDCIVLNSNEVLPVSVMLNGEYDLSDVCLSIPCRISSNGIEEKIVLNLEETEKEALNNSFSILKDLINKV